VLDCRRDLFAGVRAVSNELYVQRRGSLMRGAQRTFILVVFAVGMLSGCMLGPDYHAPDVAAMNVPPEWKTVSQHRVDMEQLSRWWEQFGDAELTALINAAQASSPTLASSLARVKRARAATDVSRSALFPTLNGTLSRTRENFDEFVNESPNLSDVGQDTSGEANRTSAGLDASWELDLFGAARRGAQASEAQLEASEARWSDAHVTLAAEVARAYVNYRECESLADYLAQALEAGEKVQRLVLLKASAGFAAPADAQFAAGNVADSVRQLEEQRGVCTRRFNQIVYLTGLDRNTLRADLARGDRRIPALDHATPPVITVALLVQRPDIRAAERNLAASNANIGVAIAKRFPDLSLSGTIAATRYDAMGQVLRLSPWTLGGSIFLPVFDGGYGAARVTTAWADYDAALASYQDAVQQATLEIENGLSGIAAAEKREAAARQAVVNYERYFSASEVGHASGALSLIDLENARQRLVSSRRDEVAAQGESALEWIALYKAVAGGWPEPIQQRTSTGGGG
jgi:multidrug efflux system outer membrane protein